MTEQAEPLKIAKSYALKNAALNEDTGSLSGYPSVTGVFDCYGDVIFPGAFQKCLPDFLRRGFVPTDHQWHWDALVGFPTLAEERGNALYSEFTFHSDQNSQDARAKCAERMAAGLEVGLSIGFVMMPGQYLYFASGKELLAYAKQKGYDLKLFDTKAITAYTGQCCGILEIEELWEYSLTPAPANPQAMAVAVKSYQPKTVPANVDVVRLSANNKALPSITAPVVFREQNTMNENTPAPTTHWKGQYLGDYVEYSMSMAAMQQGYYALSYEVADALDGWGDYKDMSDTEVLDTIGHCFDEFKTLCLSIMTAIRSGSADETPQQATLSLRKAALSQLSHFESVSLGDGLTYTKHARAVVDASQTLIERTKSRREMRLKEGRALSEANRQTLKDHRDALSQCVDTIDTLLEETKPDEDTKPDGDTSADTDSPVDTEAMEKAQQARQEKLRALRLDFLRLQVAPVI